MKEFTTKAQVQLAKSIMFLHTTVQRHMCLEYVECLSQTEYELIIQISQIHITYLCEN